jgi:hypothetical protein
MNSQIPKTNALNATKLHALHLLASKQTALHFHVAIFRIYKKTNQHLSKRRTSHTRQNMLMGLTRSSHNILSRI